jgi:glycosyltransferase involved in cell wall biosynthesis
MNALYKHPSMVGFISATRGEGFGLPMLESAVSGLPVVCTQWSSITEFLTGKSFLGVDYDLVSLPDKKIDGNIFVKEAKWANPRESSFKKMIRKLDSDHESYKTSADFLSSSLKLTHSEEKIEKEYEKIFKQLDNK